MQSMWESDRERDSERARERERLCQWPAFVSGLRSLVSCLISLCSPFSVLWQWAEVREAKTNAVMHRHIIHAVISGMVSNAARPTHMQLGWEMRYTYSYYILLNANSLNISSCLQIQSVFGFQFSIFPGNWPASNSLLKCFCNFYMALIHLDQFQKWALSER